MAPTDLDYQVAIVNVIILTATVRMIDDLT